MFLNQDVDEIIFWDRNNFQDLWVFLIFLKLPKFSIIMKNKMNFNNVQSSNFQRECLDSHCYKDHQTSNILFFSHMVKMYGWSVLPVYTLLTTYVLINILL